MSNYAQIRNMDISNGQGIGVSVFFSGCDFHCKNCFNSELWDYNYGKPFTDKEIKKIVELMDKSHITRLSILGGDGLMDCNLAPTMKLIQEVRKQYNNSKSVWLYTGYKFEDIIKSPFRDLNTTLRRRIVEMCDVLVDGRYIDELKDLTLKFRGSSNQRLVDIKETIKQGEVVLWRN